MRKGKNGIRRIAALVCSVALFATLLPVQVLATDEGMQEPLTAVTLLDENGEETVSEQGDADSQQEEAVACTKSADCAAETHEEDCPKYVAPNEDEVTDPAVSCTKDENCVAETHEEDCPKYEAPAEEEGTEPEVSCTKDENCAAETHEEGCPKYEAPAEDEGTGKEPAGQVVTSVNSALESAPALLSEQDTTVVESGNCGTEGNESAVTWALTGVEGQQENAYILTISGSGAMKDYSWDAKVGQTPWISYAAQIQKIVIEEGVTHIGNYTAYQCANATDLSIASSVQTMGQSALSGLRSLQTISLPNGSSVYAVEDGVLFNADKTTLLLYPSGKAGDTYTIPSTVTTLGISSLSYTQFKHVTIPASVTEIKTNAFFSSALTEVTVPKTVTTYGDYIFSHCTALQEVTLEHPAAIAATGILRECSSLTQDKIHLPSDYTVIGDSALKGTGITGFSIPDSVTTIKNAAFASTKLQSLVIPDTVTSFEGTTGFNSCTELKTLVVGAGLDVIPKCYECTSLESVTIKGNPTEIVGYNFYNTNLSEFTIPETVTTIGDNAFKNVDTLTSIKIPDSVTEIDSNAFLNCTGLQEVWIGSGLQSVGQAPFSNCTALQKLYINSDAVALGDLGIRGILTEVTIGSNVKVMPRSMLINQERLTTLRFEERTDPITIGHYSLSGLDAIQKIELPACAITITSYAFANNNAMVALDMTKATSITYQSQESYTAGQNAFVGMVQGSAIYVSDAAAAEGVQGKYAQNKTFVGVTNGGTFAADGTFTAGKLATPTKDGAIFEGWYESATFEGNAVDTPAAGKTYYAKWTGMDDMELQYGAKQKIVANGVTLSGYESDNTSVATVDAEGNVKAVGVGTATISATGTYNEESTTFTMTVTVTPRPIDYTLTNDETGSGSITYNYSDEHHALSESMTFKWADESDTVVSLTEGADINYTYTVEDPEAPDVGDPLIYDYLPMPVGEYTVSFNLKNPNYTFALDDGTTGNTLTVKVNVTAEGTQRAYLASAAPKADQNFVYNGQGVLPVEGTLNAYAKNDSSTSPVDIGTFTVNIEGLNGTSYHSKVSGIAAGTDLSGISGLKLPTEPGTYIITASAVNEDYYLYKSLVFTINKATVTITAADKTVVKGEALPSLTSPTEGEDYTVTGLVGDDKLTAAPTLAYAAGVDVNTVGTYAIIPSDAAADEKYYTIQYVDGTLHVEKIAIIEGADQTWTQGSGNDLEIRSNADIKNFQRVEVNGETLAKDQDYTAKSGSTIVTIKATYLNTLAAGDYTFAIVSTTGTASTHFTVKAKVAGESGASGNTGAATATPAPSGSSITYYTCPACGYHDWTAGADGYQCNHCGYVESVKQLSGYGNVTGVYEPNGGNVPQTATVAAIPQTGDNSQPLVWVALVGISGAALAALAVFRKKRSDK